MPELPCWSALPTPPTQARSPLPSLVTRHQAGHSAFYLLGVRVALACRKAGGAQPPASALPDGPQKTPVLQPCLEVSAPEVNHNKYHPFCPGLGHHIRVPHQTKCRHPCVRHTLTKTQRPLEPEGRVKTSLGTKRDCPQGRPRTTCGRRRLK